MKGPSSCCRLVLGLVLATTVACARPLRADLLVSAPSDRQASAAPVFVPHGPRPVPVTEAKIDADQEMLLQMLTVMVIPTGPLSWNNPPPPPPPPPHVGPSSPPNGGPPDPGGGTTVKTPEPSTLLLASLGVSVLGWRRYRARKAAAE